MLTVFTLFIPNVSGLADVSYSFINVYKHTTAVTNVTAVFIFIRNYISDDAFLLESFLHTCPQKVD